MKNVSAVLQAAGSSLDKVIKTTVFLADMGEFAAMNEVYGRYFEETAGPSDCRSGPLATRRKSRNRGDSLSG